jgi:ABC-type Zn uptake system ZnuABC Zn-binding protein ZnuA
MKNRFSRRFRPALWSAMVSIALPGVLGAASAGPLQVVATLPDFGSIVRTIGGDEVEVTVLAKGSQDPHFVEARPSFIRTLHSADLFVVNGMDLEIGWAPVLLRGARNRSVMPGAAGYLDASTAIAAMDVPTGTVDRSMGDVHPFGNPHYMTDPINGLRVAGLVRKRLEELRPESAAKFREREAEFRNALVGKLVGDALVAESDPAVLAEHLVQGNLDEFLATNGRTARLGGWLAAFQPHRGVRAVQDHNLWPYFARRFGLVLTDTLEPLPGIAPTTRHLSEVVGRMNADGTRLILASAYIDLRHARVVAEGTGAKVAEMAHQVGSRPGVEDYIAVVDYNVRQVLEKL